MAKSYGKLDQALKDLVEAYLEIEEELTEKHGEDEEALAHAFIEALETSVESAMEEHDCSSGSFASMLSNLSEALEQIDSAAFEGSSEDDEYELADEDYEMDDSDIDDADLDEDEDSDDDEDEDDEDLDDVDDDEEDDD